MKDIIEDHRQTLKLHLSINGQKNINDKMNTDFP